jgi:NAD+ synthase (glutamine-hydrolysing)
MDRRGFLQNAAAIAVGGATCLRRGQAKETGDAAKPRRATLAQVVLHKTVEQNLKTARRALEQAGEDNADFVLFPELFLTGGTRDLRQDETAAGMAEISELCRKFAVIGLVGTAWQEEDKLFNQVRILDATGAIAGVYAKKCLTYGDAKRVSPGTTSLVFSVGGLTAGVLICNDLWVTPGFTDGPNPHLTLQQAREGAQVIFHHVFSGNDQRYRAYHESNQFVRAVEAKCPIVTVNAFTAPEVNATSGVVGTDFRHLAALPRDREVIQTVEFAPCVRTPK